MEEKFAAQYEALEAHQDTLDKLPDLKELNLVITAFQSIPERERRRIYTGAPRGSSPFGALKAKPVNPTREGSSYDLDYCLTDHITPKQGNAQMISKKKTQTVKTTIAPDVAEQVIATIRAITTPNSKPTKPKTQSGQKSCWVRRRRLPGRLNLSLVESKLAERPSTTVSSPCTLLW